MLDGKKISAVFGDPLKISFGTRFLEVERREESGRGDAGCRRRAVFKGGDQMVGLWGVDIGC